MEHINYLYGTLDLINKTLFNYHPYTKDLSKFYDKYYPIMEVLSEKQHKFIRAMCHQKNINKVKDLLTEWSAIYAKS